MDKLTVDRPPDAVPVARANNEHRPPSRQACSDFQASLDRIVHPPNGHDVRNRPALPVGQSGNAPAGSGIAADFVGGDTLKDSEEEELPPDDASQTPQSVTDTNLGKMHHAAGSSDSADTTAEADAALSSYALSGSRLFAARASELPLGSSCAASGSTPLASGSLAAVLRVLESRTETRGQVTFELLAPVQGVQAIQIGALGSTGWSIRLIGDRAHRMLLKHECHVLKSALSERGHQVESVSVMIADGR